MSSKGGLQCFAVKSFVMVSGISVIEVQWLRSLTSLLDTLVPNMARISASWYASGVWCVYCDLS